MLLPERAFSIKCTDSGHVMPGPAALPYLCPPLGCLSRIHTPTLDKGTDKRPGQQDDEQLSCREESARHRQCELRAGRSVCGQRSTGAEVDRDRVGDMGGLIHRRTFRSSRCVIPGLAAGIAGRVAGQVVAGGGRPSGHGQACRVRGAGATADRGCCGQHKSNTSPGPGGIQHAGNTDKTAFPGTRRHAC